MQTFIKQPNDHLDYDIVLTEWLTTGDTIVAANITAPDGINVSATEISADRVKFWIEGGTTGKTYKFSPVIITFGGREKEVDFQIKVRNL